MPDVWWYEARGQWCADVRHPQTEKRLRWYLGADERAARRQFHRRMAELYGDSSLLAQAEAENVSLAVLAEAWLEWSRVNCAEKTWKWRRTYLRWIVDTSAVRSAHVPARPA